MSGKHSLFEDSTATRPGAIASIALLCMTVSVPAWSQSNDDAGEQELTASSEYYDRYEAERLRQQQQQYQQQLQRYESERQRQESEHRERERVQLENERHEQEQLQLETEARERELTQIAAAQQRTEQTSQSPGPDIYEQLRTLGELRDDGILTEQEFQDLKKKILESN